MSRLKSALHYDQISASFAVLAGLTALAFLLGEAL